MIVRLKKNMYGKGGIMFCGGIINRKYEAESAYPEFDRRPSTTDLVVYQDSSHMVALIVKRDQVNIVKQ